MLSEMMDGFAIAAACVLIVWIGAMVIATCLPPAPSARGQDIMGSPQEGGVQMSAPATSLLDDAKHSRPPRRRTASGATELHGAGSSG